MKFYVILFVFASTFLPSMQYTVTSFEQKQFTNIVLEEWESFKIVHGKVYENEIEESFRRKIYLENRHRIAEHNKGNSSFRMEMNQFGDLLFHEFNALYNTFSINSQQIDRLASSSMTFMSAAHVKLPDSVDWRDEGYVTPVKNQQSCGSCWTFGATGALEGQHFRKTGQLVSLSEQNLVDCIPPGEKYGCQGCEGGNFFGAFQFIQDEGGIDTEDSYPYAGFEQSCKFNPGTIGATDTGYFQIPISEDALLNAVATQGPIVVAIDAEERFQFYRDGVFYDPDCSAEMNHLDHAVLAVGYGSENGQDYWLVKNSWSESWGDRGYIKMSRNKNNNCGIATFAGYPLV